MKTQWQILKPEPYFVEKISKFLKCDPITAAVMVNRNIVTETSALKFLNATLNDLRPPFSMKNMNIAVQRIYTAIIKHEKILIFGDYDADGVTATTILLEFLRYTGADVSYYIPHRIKEGYSLQISHISDYAIANQINLIITVDCGSSSHDAVKTAQHAGIDVIITDHHTLSHDPPPAFAVVNPKSHDCDAGFDNLAGVGVAFSLIICLRKHLRENGFWQNIPEPNLKNFCDLVALGTIADVVPLVDENRIFSKIGLDIINSRQRIGINALIEASGINKDSANTEAIAFRLAPRLNAAGRLKHANEAVKLLTTDDPHTAKQIAQSLNHLNAKRQDIEKRIFEEILEHLNKYPHLLQCNSLVLSNPNWHQGVLGIVASRVVEFYFRPVILIATQNGIGKGSGRSIPGVDLHAGILTCSKNLEHFGGHAMAAGLTIKTENIGLFQKNFEAAIIQMTTPDSFSRRLLIDHELDFDDISDNLIDELETLQPFGEGNPEPLFMAKNVRVSSSKIVGKNHRRMILRQAVSGRSSRAINAMHFNIDTSKPFKDYFEQMAFRLKWNRWNNKKIAQIVIESVKC